MKFVIDKDIPFIRGVFEPFAEVEYVAGDAITCTTVHDADALIIRTRTHCDKSLLEGSRISFIGTATIGTDHIDKEFCRLAGITTASAPGCNSRAVLQWVAAALKTVCATTLRKPSETTLGVIGVGHVGSLVADYAEQWGFTVLRNDPPREKAENSTNFVSLETLLRNSDIVTVHTPYTTAGQYRTANLLNDNALTVVRNGAFIFNAARGGIVDEQALLRLKLGAAIDTWENEPHISRELLSKALIATPHIAGYSIQGKSRGTEIIVKAASQHFGIDAKFKNSEPSVAHKISWEEMCRTIDAYCNIMAETKLLKLCPNDFEHRRNGYPFRNEYF